MSATATPHAAQGGVHITERLEPYGITVAKGPTVPADAIVGYSPGCLFQHLDAASAITCVYVNTGTKASAAFRPLYPFAQGAALTAQLTSITHTAPGTPDYAIQNLTNSSPFGFVNADEGNTVLSVILNLQVRLAEVEARLEAAGIVAAN
jgi:hypothetical protein